MKTKFLSTIVALGLLAGAGSSISAAERVRFNDLPEPVQRTINQEIGGGAIGGIQRMELNGVPVYEIRRTEGPDQRPLYVSESGSVINLAQVIGSRPGQDVSRKAEFRDLPRAVQDTIRLQAGRALIEDINMITRHGRTHYEVGFQRNEVPVRMAVDPQGNVLEVIQQQPQRGQGQQGFPRGVEAPERVPLAAARKVPFGGMPREVQETVQKYSEGARIEDIDRGTVQGRVTYQVAFKHGGEHIELRVAEDGSLVHDDQNARFLARTGQMSGEGRIASASWQSAPARVQLSQTTEPSLREIPAEVMQTVRRYAGDSRIEDVDRGLAGGQTAYQFAFKHRGEHVELRVAEDGTLVRDQENARFLARFNPERTDQTAAGSGPSWQVLQGGDRSWDALGTGEGAVRGQLMNATSVGFNQLPREVQNALRSEAGNGAITHITRGTVNNQTVFEARLNRGTREVQVRVGEDGRVLR